MWFFLVGGGCFCFFCMVILLFVVFLFKQKTAYEMRISDWSSDVCSSDLIKAVGQRRARHFALVVEKVAGVSAQSPVVVESHRRVEIDRRISLGARHQRVAFDTRKAAPRMADARPDAARVAATPFEFIIDA